MTIGCSYQVDVVGVAWVSSVTKVSVLKSSCYWCLSCGITLDTDENMLYEISIAARCMRRSVDDLSLPTIPPIGLVIQTQATRGAVDGTAPSDGP